MYAHLWKRRCWISSGDGSNVKELLKSICIMHTDLVVWLELDAAGELREALVGEEYGCLAEVRRIVERGVDGV